MIFIKRTFILFITFAIILIIAGVATTPGLHLFIKIINQVSSTSIKVTNLKGSLINPLSFDSLFIDDSKNNLKLINGQLSWKVSSWQPLKITIMTLHLDELNMTNYSQSNTTPTSSFKRFNFPGFALHLILQSLTVDKVNIDGLEMNKLSVQAYINQEQWAIKDISLDYNFTRLSLRAMGNLQKNHPISAMLNVTPLTPNTETIHGQIDLKGDANLYHWKGKFTGLVPIELTGTLDALNNQFKLKSSLSWGVNTLDVVGDPFDSVQIKASIPRPQILHPSLEGLDTKIIAQGMISHHRNELILTIAPGVYHLPENDTVSSIPFQGGQLILKKTSKKQFAIGHFSFNPNTAIDFSIQSHQKRWMAQGSIRSFDKLIDLKGHGVFSQGLTGQLALEGDDFPVMRTPEYMVNISPKLTITVKPDAYQISGYILVPKVRLKLITFSDTVNLTEDAVFIHHDEIKNTPIQTNISADVQIKMGKDVTVDVQGLHGNLDGAIQIKQEPNLPIRALGELTIRAGTYKAYGQDLTISHGALLFSGSSLTNPDINLRAVRQFNHNTSNFSGSSQLFDFNATNLQTIDLGNRVTVGVQVAGHLYSPKITLFSIPARLSQADILSMLLLGKPANQASQSGGKLLLTAITAMKLDSGSKGMQLLSQLKETLGLDFDIQPGTPIDKQSNNQGTAVSVGKSLTKRLYLSYSLGLTQEDNNLLTLKYLLNKYFSLQVTASNTGNGVDMLYNATP